MFDANQKAKLFEENRGDIQSQGTQTNRDLSLRKFEMFAELKYNLTLEELLESIKINPPSVYEALKEYANYELEKKGKKKKSLTTSSVKLRLHYIKEYFSRHGIRTDDKSRLKDVIGKTLKHRREPVTHANLEMMCNNASHKIKSLILIQSSSGMRVSEMLHLKVKDVTKLERYQIKIRADNSKTKTERITFVSKEAEPYLEYFLKNKSPDDLIFDYSKSAFTHALQLLLIKCGLDKKYDHCNTNLITSHSFRAFFITNLGKLEGFFGHSLSGHDHYMSQYDRYTPEELEEKYMEGEQYLQIFDRKNPAKLKKLEDKVENQQKIIERLEKENKYRDDMFRTADQDTKNKIVQLLMKADKTSFD